MTSTCLRACELAGRRHVQRRDGGNGSGGGDWRPVKPRDSHAASPEAIVLS